MHQRGVGEFGVRQIENAQRFGAGDLGNRRVIQAAAAEAKMIEVRQISKGNQRRWRKVGRAVVDEQSAKILLAGKCSEFLVAKPLVLQMNFVRISGANRGRLMGKIVLRDVRGGRNAGRAPEEGTQ